MNNEGQLLKVFWSVVFLAAMFVPATVTVGDAASEGVNTLQELKQNLTELLDGSFYVNLSSVTSYTPVTYDCGFSSDTLVVQPLEDYLSTENNWVAQREIVIKNAWADYLQNLGFKNLDVEEVVNSDTLPRVAIAASGGGFRATLTGAGVLQSMDSRNDSAVNAKTGGLQQIATYIAGLSGGSWLLGLLLDQDGVSVDDWVLDLTQSTLFPGSGYNEIDENYLTFLSEIQGKKNVGFETSYVDLWGRLLSYQLYPNDTASVGVLFNSFANSSAIQQYEFPFPIVLTALIPNSTTTFYNSVPLEFNLYSTGVVTGDMNGYFPTPMLGTSFSNGAAANGECVQGFDNLGFVVGCSSAAFAVLQNYFSMVTNNATAEELVTTSTAKLPNPYKGMYGEVWDQDEALVGDGGIGPMGNIPLWPLILPQRGVDIIFAFDNSADTKENYPNGTALLFASSFAAQNGMPFPEIPSSPTEFLNDDLNEGMTWFGCGNSTVPTIVYIPNQEVTYNSGTSTFKLSYSAAEQADMISNAFAFLTAAPKGTGSSFGECIGCLLLNSTGYSSSQCSSCESTFCWTPSTSGSILG